MSKMNRNPNPESNEEWRPIKGFEGLYEVSSLGRVRSVERDVPFRNETSHRGARIKKTFISSGTGYEMVSLWKDGNNRLFTIHRLVATAFVPNPHKKEAIDHINTNRLDNRPENLRWCTNKENCNNPISLINYSKSHKGRVNDSLSIEKWKESRKKWKDSEAFVEFRQKRRERSKHILQLSKDGTVVNEFSSAYEASEAIGKKPCRIYSVLDKPNRTVGGYLWKTKRLNTE